MESILGLLLQNVYWIRKPAMAAEPAPRSAKAASLGREPFSLVHQRWRHTMKSTRLQLSLLPGVLLAFVLGTSIQADERKEDPKKSGAVVGVVTAKGVAWVEVKADGEQKARRYVANWVGGVPKEGGGPDPKMVKAINGLKVGSRVRLEWKFDERPRVVKIEVLKDAGAKGTPEKDDKKEAVKKGTLTGKLTAKEPNWIEVQADGEEKARRYFFHRGGTKQLREAIQQTTLGSRVRIDWIFVERPRVVKLEVIKKVDSKP
jgi:hypothetical protein